EGAQAMTYGDPQGYIGLRELICHKYQLFEMMKTRPENIVVANGSGQALSLAFSAFVDPGDAIIIEAPTFSGSLNTIRRHGLRFEGETLPPLYALDRGGRVIRAGTLSKILGAGVRLGWLCAPKDMVPVLQSFLFGGGTNPFMSRVATYYMKDNMAAHVQRLIGVYRAKRDAMLKGLDEVLRDTDATISRPEGGFFLWIKLPSGTDKKRLAERAVEARIQYTPGPVFYANGGGE